ncbi:MAG: septation protein SpoVG family protein [Candidatus Omnitrophica bacterium]|nr:septation protein SpoVG family protein [Candidatus Omnitrophota bacterium]
MSQDVLDLKIMKIHRLPEGNRIKAFVDLGINDALLIKGLRVIDSQKGLFVSMPQEQGKNERWYERVR